MTRLFLPALALLLAPPARAQTYTVGQNLGVAENRTLHAGESVRIPAGTAYSGQLTIGGPRVTVLNEGTWGPNEVRLDSGAVVTNQGHLQTEVLHIGNALLTNTGRCEALYIVIDVPGRLYNAGWLASWGDPRNNSIRFDCGQLAGRPWAEGDGALVVACGPAPPLPVTLVSFTARRAGAQVLLEWVVAQEVNTRRYEVESSPDGRRFAWLSEVPATGARAYRSAAPASEATTYYRLRMVDADQSFAYSPVAVVGAPGARAAVYYDFTGRQLPRPAAGFYIAVTTWADGRVTRQKFYQP